MIITLTNTSDRMVESHWHIHQMELHFHFADPFRFSLNSFLRSLKEIPQILQMEVQRDPALVSLVRDEQKRLREDPLISYLFKQRDIVVHREMLQPTSGAEIGISEFKRMKIGMGMNLDPMTDSDVGMLRYLCFAGEREDVLGLIENDPDSMPCVRRYWRLKEFANEDIVDVAAHAWEELAKTIVKVCCLLGEPEREIRMQCMHGSKQVNMRIYPREVLKEMVVRIKEGKPELEILNELRQIQSRKAHTWIGE